jgi:hypothetical protein
VSLHKVRLDMETWLWRVIIVVAWISFLIDTMLQGARSLL